MGLSFSKFQIPEALERSKEIVRSDYCEGFLLFLSLPAVLVVQRIKPRALVYTLSHISQPCIKSQTRGLGGSVGVRQFPCWWQT